jgi:hypothetical protein
MERMSDIYTSAAPRVVAWLEPESNSSTLALQTLDKVNSQIKIEVVADIFDPPLPKE